MIGRVTPRGIRALVTLGCTRPLRHGCLLWRQDEPAVATVGGWSAGHRSATRATGARETLECDRRQQRDESSALIARTTLIAVVTGERRHDANLVHLSAEFDIAGEPPVLRWPPVKRPRPSTCCSSTRRRNHRWAPTPGCMPRSCGPSIAASIACTRPARSAGQDRQPRCTRRLATSTVSPSSRSTSVRRSLGTHRGDGPRGARHGCGGIGQRDPARSVDAPPPHRRRAHERPPTRCGDCGPSRRLDWHEVDHPRARRLGHVDESGPPLGVTSGRRADRRLRVRCHDARRIRPRPDADRCRAQRHRCHGVDAGQRSRRRAAGVRHRRRRCVGAVGVQVVPGEGRRGVDQSVRPGPPRRAGAAGGDRR